MMPWNSSNIYKNVERERQNFFVSGVNLTFIFDKPGEKLPEEEGMKLRWLGIPKDCSLRRKMYIVAVWLSPKSRKDLSFEQARQIFGKDGD